MKGGALCLGTILLDRSRGLEDALGRHLWRGTKPGGMLESTTVCVPRLGVPKAEEKAPPVILREDMEESICLAQNPLSPGRKKHIDLDIISS